MGVDMIYDSERLNQMAGQKYWSVMRGLKQEIDRLTILLRSVPGDDRDSRMIQGTITGLLTNITAIYKQGQVRHYMWDQEMEEPEDGVLDV